MAIILEAITSVWHAGRLVQPTEKFSVDEEFAEKLIKGGSAKVSKSVEKEKIEEKTEEKVEKEKSSKKKAEK